MSSRSLTSSSHVTVVTSLLQSSVHDVTALSFSLAGGSWTVKSVAGLHRSRDSDSDWLLGLASFFITYKTVNRIQCERQDTSLRAFLKISST
jgi:hypothetical protein